jgi:hypothetical protein
MGPEINKINMMSALSGCLLSGGAGPYPSDDVRTAMEDVGAGDCDEADEYGEKWDDARIWNGCMICMECLRWIGDKGEITLRMPTDLRRVRHRGSARRVRVTSYTSQHPPLTANPTQPSEW